MILELLDINAFIRENKCLEVTNSRFPTKSGYEPGSLWDPAIFGHPGSNDRKNRFGYIDLKHKFIHPSVFIDLKVMSEETSGIISGVRKYSVLKDTYVLDENGETGLYFLLKTIKDINLEKIAKPNKADVASFLNKNKDKFIIDKYLVIPANIRDIDIRTGGNMQVTSPINDFYKSVIYNVSNISGVDEIDSVFVNKAQYTIIEIFNWLMEYMKGKGGIFRNSMLKKTLDYSSRIVLASSPYMKLGEIGVPWHVLISIYEPLFAYQINNNFKDVKDEIIGFLGKNELNIHDIINFVNTVNKNPNMLSGLPLKESIIKVLNVIVKDAVVIVKRDPVAHRNNWFSAKPIIIEGSIAQLCDLDLAPIGGDSDGDTIEILPIFSKQAKNEANAKLNPVNSSSKWRNIVSSTNTVYSPQDDAVSAIFNATK